jgi:hypothetical protein
MNAATLMMAPLRVTLVSTRWITLLVLGLMLTASIALQLTQSASSTVLIAPIISGYGEFFVGLLFVAPFLLMAIDTRLLRIPRSQSTVVLAMLLYGAAWIVVPTVALTFAGAHFVPVLAIQTIGLLFGLTFGLLPRVFLIVAGLLPSLMGVLRIPFHYPGKATVLMLWLISALLAAIAAWCWRRQVRMSDPYGDGFNRPLVVRSRANNPGGHWNEGTLWSGNLRQIRSQPGWMQATANLDHAGPDDPVRSLRIGVGGWILPKTWQSALRQWLLVTGPIALVMVLMFLRMPDAVTDIWRAIGFSVVVWLTGFGSMFIALTTVMLLQQRWSRAHAELPLLALLPGLGAGEPLKRNLLRATWLPALFWQIVLIALLSIASLIEHATGWGLTMAVLAQIAALAFTPAFMIATIGRHPPAPWMAGLIAGVSFALVGCSTAASSIIEISRTYGSIASASMTVIWLVILALLMRMGWRGWHSLQALPHPFLAN